MIQPRFAVIILAAGEGSRMKSAAPKVLHPVAGQPMIRYLIDALDPLEPAATIVVLGPGMDQVERAVYPADTVVQPAPRGTADAVLVARELLTQRLEAEGIADVAVLFGDTPLLRGETISALLEARRRSPEAVVAVAGFRPADPGAYGRLAVDASGALQRIVEERDASPAEREIKLCNGGIMAIAARHLFAMLDRIGNDNSKREYYLTDIVAVARDQAFRCRVVELPAEDLLGVNTRADLAAAEAAMQERLRRGALEQGATLLAPETVFLCADTQFGRDVVVEPNVVFGPGVSIADGARIRAFSHIEGAQIGERAIVGPFARLRPGATLEAEVHVGNFVEVKATRLGRGAKANHLSYLGDTEVGAGTNIGAGTITCNYDGFNKARTIIGAGAFIGSNTALVAPVSVGDRAYVATGSVVTANVPPDALTIARARQVDKPGRAAELRARLQGKERLMCGIVGIIAKRPVAPELIEGLRRLEYRGYDLAGVATLVNGHIERRRAEGKLGNLCARLDREPVHGTIGIGHTRWATHGQPTEGNAHPIATDRVAVVHNGIIENFQALKTELSGLGHQFHTQTDTEAVAILVTHYLMQGMKPADAVAKALPRLDGAFALVFLFAGEHDLLICARRGSPLAIGYGDGEMFVGSDLLALAPLTRRITYLEEGDWAVVTSRDVAIYDRDNNRIGREVRETALSGALIGKGNFRHFMQKEIFEQPAVIGDTLQALINPATRSVHLPDLPFALGDIGKITTIACGTAHHAGMIAKYWLEKIARIPVEADIASEFRYRAPAMPRDGAALVISQSGETADTLAALRYCREAGQKIIAIVNQPESTIAREADVVLPTLAGPEIGVASTKAFTTQLAVLAAFTVAMARARGTIDADQEAALAGQLAEIPSRASEVLNHDERLQEIAAEIALARDVLYLGRGTSFPLALEGALKLKEISYIHAEGYAAGEMKHGPIALIDDNVPVIVLAPPDELFDKTLSNVEETMARGGRVVLISDAAGVARLEDRLAFGVTIPHCAPFVAPLLYAIPVQLLAYHVAVLKGTDVDQPRNLAKSVTVE